MQVVLALSRPWMGGGKEIPAIVGTYQGVLGEELDHKNEMSLKIPFWVLWLLQTGGRKRQHMLQSEVP